MNWMIIAQADEAAPSRGLQGFICLHDRFTAFVSHVQRCASRNACTADQILRVCMQCLVAWDSVASGALEDNAPENVILHPIAMIRCWAVPCTSPWEDACFHASPGTGMSIVSRVLSVAWETKNLSCRRAVHKCGTMRRAGKEISASPYRYSHLPGRVEAPEMGCRSTGRASECLRMLMSFVRTASLKLPSFWGDLTFSHTSSEMNWHFWHPALFSRRVLCDLLERL